MRALLAIALVTAALAVGCKKTADVSVTGRLSGVNEGDSVFVTLSREWDRGITPPISFEMDAEGKFAIRLSVGNPPPPLTFVKNDSAVARLEFKDTWGYAPVLVDRIGGKEFPVTVISESLLSAKGVNLP
jgi:hypothetical protein